MEIDDHQRRDGAQILKLDKHRASCSLEHDAEKCGRFSDDIMLYFFDLEQDSDFRPIRPKIILF
ncbi:hypothetical protein ELI13_23070 [Rhizobium ruizarguesonis]|uniref:Uncharacterized protein n=1 Tax=Rhizobium ruizarguesonis TaxID=2081791 RepID=A0AB38IAG2_9HYPH|nr:hypothetical protein [Rhizobium leguminosarum bv. viciae]TAT86342.1 hypothetical protein ELI52_23915 [Rhizobium ruizarguesonis]TAU12524.1 hypothetical protein ELI49_23570 [Rhizobium ruizarguesonis]TAU33981.1 hypothetical protein ELI47_24215 [Rhizobium ruizarguesonis]TAU78874.1 hypothetical protein ELI46_23725 [Rhizobium ruizarguesonis]